MATRFGHFAAKLFRGYHRGPFNHPGRGDDQVNGNDGNNVIRGGRGNDDLNGGGGNDRIFGGPGSDKINGGPGRDIVWGSHGNDTVIHDAAEDNGSGDIYHGGRGDDTLRLIVTPEIANSPAFQATLAQFRAEIAANGSTSGEFSDLKVTFTSFENIEVVINNSPPTVTVGDPNAVAEGDSGASEMVTVTVADHVTISDPDASDAHTPYAGGLALQGTSGPAPDGGLDGLFVVDPATGTISYDRSAFDYLADGESVTATFSFNAASGPDTVARTITVTIVGVNDAPVATGESATTDEDTPVNIAVLANDTDADASDTLSVASAAADNGSVVIEADGTLTYTPNAGFDGNDVITYTVSDGHGGEATATVAVEVIADNQPPSVSLTPLVASLAEDADTSAPIRIADIHVTDDDDGVANLSLGGADAASFSIIGDGLYLNAGVALDFETKTGFDVTVQVDDPDIAGFPEGAAAISLAVTDVDETNDPPTITLTPVVTSLLENADTSVPIKVADLSISDDQLGTNVLSLGGADADSFMLGPDGLYLKAGVGLDFETKTSFDVTVMVDDADVGGSPDDNAVFSLAIENVNEAPVAGPAVADQTATEEAAFNFTLPADAFSDVDGDPLALTATLSDGSPLPAWLNFDGATFSGTPDDGDGPVEVTVTASDGAFTAEQTFTIDMVPVNDAPVIADQTLSIAEENLSGAAVGNVVASDVDNAALGYAITAGNDAGLFAVDTNTGAISLAQGVDDAEVGSYALTVEVSDGALASSATVTIDVTAVNDAPVASSVDLGAIVEDDVRVITAAQLLAGVSDVDGPAPEITALSIQSGGGSLADNGDGTWTYTPAAGDDSAVTFSYTASDGDLTATSTASLDLTPVNDAPVAAPVDLGSSAEDDLRVITSAQLLAGVSDVDGPGATITALSIQSGGGSLTDNGDGTWTYTPAADDDGAVTFAYSASDGEFTGSSTASLDLTPVNDAPVTGPAIGDQAATEETAFNFTVPANAFSDVDNASLSLTATLADGSPLPAWLNFDGASFSGTPDDGDNSIQVTVTASDGEFTAEQTFTINVMPVNDAPVIADQSLSIAEESVSGAAVGSVAASDVDNASLIYAITSGNDAGLFAIDAGTGAITLAQGVDDAEVGSYALTVEVSDGSLASSATVTANVTPVNDAPVIADQSFSIAEESLSGAAVGSVAASDVDNAALIYTITAGNDLGLFAIDPDTGAITLAQGVDDAEVGSCALTVEVSDGALANSATVTVDVTPVNDAPVITDQTFSIAEESLSGAAVGVVVVSDVDNASLIYAITSGNEAGLFAIDSGTGAITLAQGVDDAEVGSYALTVEVSDGSLASSATVTVDVTPVNDAPVIADQSFSIAEESTSGAAVGSVAASDVDNAALIYTITAGNDLGLFDIDADTGAITLAQGVDDVEVGSYALTVEVSDGALTNSATVTVDVTPVNDAPVITDQTFSIAEESLSGAAVGVVVASDVDNASLIYAITSGNEAGLFAIDAGTGAITLAQGVDDAEVGSYALTVEVSDGSLASSATVTVDVTPVNDAPVAGPAIGDQAATEESAFNFTVPANAFSDVDNASLSLTATLSDGSPLPAWLSFDGASFSGTPDDGDNSIQVKVTASDGEFSAEQIFTINVMPVNDAPVIADQSFSIAEESSSGAAVGSVAASDVDNASLIYSIAAGNDLGLFAIDADTGAITLAQGVDDAEVGSYALTVEVSDSVLASSATVTVDVTPVNDAPVIADQTFSIAEESLSGAAVGSVAASDVDNAALIYTITAGNDLGLFAIDPDTGAITLAQGVDDAEVGSHALTVEVSDGILASSATVTVDITPVNDAPVAAPVDLGSSAEDTSRVISAAELLGRVSDVDGPAPTITAVTIQSGGGSLVDNGNDTWTYTPADDDDGAVVFDYTATDGEFSSSSTASLDLTPVNDAPVVDQGIAHQNVDEDSAWSFTVPADAFADVDGDQLTLTATLGDGSALPVWLSFDGTSFSGTPPQDFNGDIDLKVTASDGGESVEVDFTLTVDPVNDAPELSGTLSAAMDEGATHVIGASELGSTDPDDIAADAVYTVSNLVNGAILVNGAVETTFTGQQLADGLVAFAHDGSESTAASFSVAVEDGNEDGSVPVPQTFNITVAPVNDAPVAQDDEVATDEVTVLNGDLFADNGSGTDDDADGDVFTVSQVNGQSANVGSQITLASGALLLVNADGTFAYDPYGAFATLTPGQSDIDSFTYTIDDGNGGIDIATVNVTVFGDSNEAPVVVDDSIQVLENRTVTYDILGNDSDPEGGALTIARIAGQDIAAGETVTLASGALVTLNADGTITYDPAGQFDPIPGIFVLDNFSYEVTDVAGNITSGNVNVDIQGSEPPVVVNDPVEVRENETATFDPLANDSDPEGDPLTITSIDGQAIALGQTVSLTGGGLMTLNNDGTVTFDPNGEFPLNPGESNNFGVSYTVTDTAGNSVSGTIVVNVVANEPPVAVTDNLVVIEQGSVTADLTANDSDPEGDLFAIVRIEGFPIAAGETVNLASGGSVTLNLDGTVTYTANPALDVAPGTPVADSFFYEIEDAAGNVTAGQVNVEIQADLPPVVVTDDVSVSQSNTVSFDPLGNDSDPEGGALTLIAVENQIINSGDTITLDSGALLTLNTDGTLTYDPNGMFSPAPETPDLDSLTYEVSDAFGNITTGTINIEILHNVAPTVTDDSFTALIGETVTYDVLANDTDVDGDPLTVARIDGQDIAPGGSVVLSSGAEVTLNLDGTLSFNQNGAYNPPPGAPDLESFEYEVADGAGHLTPGLVTVTIRAPNVAPVLTGTLSATLDEGAAHVLTAGELGWTDPDNAAAEVLFTVTDQTNGIILVDGVALDSFTGAQLAAGLVSFVHDGSETVAASFSVTVEDGDEDGSIPVAQAFNMTVNPVNDAPTASDDAAMTIMLAPVIIDVLANDTDPEGDNLQLVSVGVAANGSVAIVDDNSDGTPEIEYTPDFDYIGTDTFTYDVQDGSGAITTATVTVSVVPDPNNAPPVVEDESIQVVENGIETIDLLANDSDPEGGALRITRIDGQNIASGGSVTLASGALVTLNLDGTITYDPNSAFNPAPSESVSDSFTYDVRDAAGHTVTGNVAVEVTGSEPPIVGDDQVDVLDNETATFDALANDIDPEEDPLTIVSIDGQSIVEGQTISLSGGGLLTLNPNGTLTYNPNGEFDLGPGRSANFAVAYTVTDDAGNSADGTIFINVLSSDPPVFAGTTGNDVFTGGSADEYILGDLGNDTLDGAGGDDVIDGGAGNDILTGGTGDDILIGGEDSDIFVINVGDGPATIADFEQGGPGEVIDRIELNGYGIAFSNLDSDNDGALTVADDAVTGDAGGITVQVGSDTVTVSNVTSLLPDDLLFT